MQVAPVHGHPKLLAPLTKQLTVIALGAAGGVQSFSGREAFRGEITGLGIRLCGTSLSEKTSSSGRLTLGLFHRVSW